MFDVLFLVLLLVICVLAPWLGVDSRDRSVRSDKGWFPPMR